MMWSLHLTIVWVSVFFSVTLTSMIRSNASTNEAIYRAAITASRLTTCEYQNNSGLWKNELNWQSGNTLETLANYASLLDSPATYIFHQTFVNTDMFVGGDCFDDYQWWLLGWLQAYRVEPNINYLYRNCLD